MGFDLRHSPVESDGCLCEGDSKSVCLFVFVVSKRKKSVSTNSLFDYGDG